jgi:hypothetical protein
MQVQTNEQTTVSISQIFKDALDITNKSHNLYRKANLSTDPEILTNIYQEQCNIAVWQRELPLQFVTDLQNDISQRPIKNYTIQVSSDSIKKDIANIANDRHYGDALRAYIGEAIEMFCLLFDVNKVGLRLSTLDRAMCPRFHVDKVPCRLVSTFSGAGTQWLPHNVIDRSKLGHGSNGKSDETSGLISTPDLIQNLHCGDVALLKGETWENNEGAGLVHRSPALEHDEVRLLMTLDFVL